MTVQYSLSGPGGGTGLPPQPMLPDKWPVSRNNARMKLVSAPPSQGAVGSAEGDVGVMLYFKDNLPNWCVVVHQGAPEAVRQPSCDYARAAGYAIGDPSRYGPLPMIVRWKRGRPSLIAPVHQSTYAAAPASGNGAVVRGEPHPAALDSEATVYLDVTTTGEVTRCRIARSAGTDRADIAMCSQLAGQRFRPAEDVFGQPIDSSAYTKVRFE